MRNEKNLGLRKEIIKTYISGQGMAPISWETGVNNMIIGIAKARSLHGLIILGILAIFCIEGVAQEPLAEISVSVGCPEEIGGCRLLGSPTGGFLRYEIYLDMRFWTGKTRDKNDGDFLFRLIKPQNGRRQEILSVGGKENFPGGWRNSPCPECGTPRLIEIDYSDSIQDGSAAKRVEIVYPFAYQRFKLGRRGFRGTARLVLTDGGGEPGTGDEYELYFDTSETKDTYGNEVRNTGDSLPPVSGLIFKGKVARGDLKISRVLPKQCWQDIFTSFCTMRGGPATSEDALRVVNYIERNDPKWLEYLPSCPLREPSMEFKWTSWSTGNPISDYLSNLSCFHPGANRCYRTTGGYRSPGHYDKGLGEAQHCQQCCYDKVGELITAGAGAGTPDFECSEDTAKHCNFDVRPWTALGFERYNQTWRPNQGMIRVPADRVTDSGWDVTFGEIIEFEADPSYRISLSKDISAGPAIVGPGGTTPSSCQAKPFSDAPCGALLARIAGFNSPLLVGSGTRIAIPASGRILLGVNDTSLPDNTGSFAVSIRRVAK